MSALANICIVDGKSFTNMAQRTNVKISRFTQCTDVGSEHQFLVKDYTKKFYLIRWLDGDSSNVYTIYCWMSFRLMILLTQNSAKMWHSFWLSPSDPEVFASEEWNTSLIAYHHCLASVQLLIHWLLKVRRESLMSRFAALHACLYTVRSWSRPLRFHWRSKRRLFRVAPTASGDNYFVIDFGRRLFLVWREATASSSLITTKTSWSVNASVEVTRAVNNSEP